MLHGDHLPPCYSIIVAFSVDFPGKKKPNYSSARKVKGAREFVRLVGAALLHATGDFGSAFFVQLGRGGRGGGIY